MRDQDPHGPGSPPPPGDGRELGTRGRSGESRRGRNGHPVPPPAGARFAEATGADDDGPVDLVELQADDELINALSSGLGVSGPGNRGYDVDDRLVALLSSWKEDVDREPVPELVGTDEAVGMLQPAKPSRRISFLRPLVAAAAVAACALAVVSIGAHEARPGDALWGVTKVLYSEHAEQVQAATDLREGIERVHAKLAVGDTAGAREDLAALEPLLERTGPDQRAEFAQQNRFLTQKVAETPPGTPTDPRAPLRDGTPAPPPPASTEARPDEPPAPAPRPESGTSTPGGTSGGGTSPAESTSPGGGDPQVLTGPERDDPPQATTTAPSRPSQTSPTTEGSPDPSTTSTTPTASGEGEADRDEPTSSTSTGAVSSTPN